MPDYQAVFTAGSRRRVVTFKTNVNTEAELERRARDRLRNTTTIPVENWEIARLSRVAYTVMQSEEAG